MAGPGFAVIDCETTGLFASGHDRIIEIAIVHVDSHGSIEGRWETLINPQRDLGPQRIHHIRAADVLDAPTFSQIAAQLVELLDGRVIVAHNASFDMKFLVSELQRTATWFATDFVTLCTMQLARDYLPGAGRALADCCAALDIPLDDAHRACADAYATAQLLAAYIHSVDEPQSWQPHLDAALAFAWPTIDGETGPWMPRPQRSEVTAASFLKRITEKMPEYAGPADCLNYLALLDRCLLDRHVSVHESRQLIALAEDLGISRTTCELLHLEYFTQLTRAAWLDGVLSDSETADLLRVADLLDLPTATVAGAIEHEAAHLAGRSVQPVHAFELAPGDVIALTGEMSRPRSEIAAMLSDLGYVPWAAVTKKVRLLVAGDPDSLSGKARKARDYGIPVVDESGLDRLLGL